MFFGSIEHEIVGEITKIVNRHDDSDETIGPVDWDRLSRVRQHEIIAPAANAQARNPVQMLIWQAGNVLVAAGQKMMQAGNQVIEGQNVAAQIVSEDC